MLKFVFFSVRRPFNMKYHPQSEVQPTYLPIIARTNEHTLLEVLHKPTQSDGLPCLRQPAYGMHGKLEPFLKLHQVLLQQIAFLSGQWLTLAGSHFFALLLRFNCVALCILLAHLRFHCLPCFLSL